LLATDPAYGDVVILCQPAEETAQGARAMMDPTRPVRTRGQIRWSVPRT
jgi:hypothetical protein